MPRYKQLTVDHDQIGGVAVAQHQPSSHESIFDVGEPRYLLPGWFYFRTLSAQLTVDRQYFILIALARPQTFTRVLVTVLTLAAGAVARLALYDVAFDGDGQMNPGDLVTDFGAVTVATTGEKAILIDETIPAGLHFLSVSSNGQPFLTAIDANSGVSLPLSGLFSTGGSSLTDVILSVAIVDGGAAALNPAPLVTAIEGPGRAVVRLRY